MRWLAMALVLALAVVGLSRTEAIRARLDGTATAVDATALPPLKGPVILTVTGLDPARFPGGRLLFDQARLLAPGTSHFRTSTVWTDGPHDFEGLSLAAFVRLLGLRTGTLTAQALNDYSVDIPVSDAVEDGPLIAVAIDGQPMPLRDKGPLWIVYPYDQHAEYRSEVIYTRSIWQLASLEVKP